jgi:chaperone required for assembly of F1-ATPase
MSAPTPDAARPKRFWKEACVGPRAQEGSYPVLLDGRPARTPGGGRLMLPSEALALAVADEWETQGEHLALATMPLTRLAFTALDRTPAHREAVADEIAKYAGSDLLCYFAEEPEALVERQAAQWGPLLAWAETRLEVRLERAGGVVHRPQPPEALDRVRRLALELDDFRLTGLAWATALLGSAVLAFALERGELDAAAAFELSRLDEAFQIERWGEDPEAEERTVGLRAQAMALGRWFAALA